MRLETASLIQPCGLMDLLARLGDGENGFGGTPVHTGEVTLEEYLQQCCDMPDPDKLMPGYVPQTIFWLLDDDGLAVGMVRVRHHLNEKLRFKGGHIGYYVRPDQRGKGYGREALRLALLELSKLGEKRALITVDDDNGTSICVVERNGGCLEDRPADPDTGKTFRRYWIELERQRAEDTGTRDS